MKRYKVAIVLSILSAVIFIGIAIYEIIRPPKYVRLNFHHQLPLTVINKNYVRGAILINDTLIVDPNVQLVENKSNIDPLDDLHPKNSSLSKQEKDRTIPRLAYLAYPYVVYKKKNNDTLIIIKNRDDTLKYTLTYQLSDVNALDTLSFTDLIKYIFERGK